MNYELLRMVLQIKPLAFVSFIRNNSQPIR